MTQLSDDLRAARKRLEPRDHWMQGKWFERRNRHGCYCLGGALRAATGCPMGWDSSWWGYLPSRYDNTVRAVNRVLPEIYRDAREPQEAITKYNDAPGRQHRHVLMLMDRAIAAAEEGR